ncbi:gamma-glutamyl hydrolase-like isoform X2 [Mercenaria mercenaria]|nr:gamma-glutamyl hydrolase-like isoform X2 [Mercenaria mercenaria]XP_045214856.2 gamma-glutamyl hydrolase-like isoform X2 [Mercenaria mercenaria]
MLLQYAVIVTFIPYIHGYSIDARLSTNARPIIGVLAQETDSESKHYGDTYIPAGYFKYLEMAGARAVPVFVKREPDYYDHIFKSINGVLFPGGGVDLINSEYAKAAKILYTAALKATAAGDYFPMWGTCLGFQLLTALATGKDLMSDFDAEDLAIPLNFSDGYQNSRLYGNLPEDVYYFLSKEDVTVNFHHYGITPTTFQLTSDLKKMFRVLSTNVDRNGKEFISTIEGIDYPIYGTQWHPEKPNFTWNSKDHINHGPEAIRVAQYVANFFVAEARKSGHRFSSQKEEIDALIENYNPVYHKDYTFEDRYYFNYTSASFL